MSAAETEGKFCLVSPTECQCEYENDELPCLFCKSRGIICGAAEKVLSPDIKRKTNSNKFVGRHVFDASVPKLFNSGRSTKENNILEMLNNHIVPQGVHKSRSIALIREAESPSLHLPCPINISLPWPDAELSVEPFRFVALALGYSLQIQR
jgi:hypothetical protein